MGYQLLALLDTPLDTYLLDLLVSGALQHLFGQLFGQIHLEGLGYDIELCGSLQGLDTGDDGYVDAFGTRPLHEVEVLTVVVEELGHGIFGTCFHLLLEPVEVALHVGSLVVLLGVAGHAVGEGGLGDFHLRTIYTDASVEAVDLFLQLHGMGVATRLWSEELLVLGLVATQYQQVGDTQKLQVEQDIFGILTVEAAAEDVGYGSDAVAVLDGGSYGYCAGAPTYAVALEEAIAQVLIDELAAVGGDVDVFGVEFAQGINVLIHFFDASTLDGRQYFEGEGGLLCAVYQVCYSHILELLIINGANIRKFLDYLRIFLRSLC